MTEAEFLTATRAFYDAVAVDYAARFRAGLSAKPLDRAMLTAFAELVRTPDLGPVADVGCGTGNAAGYLHSHGVSVFGIDLSPAMLALARAAHPDLTFTEGAMTALDVADGALGGVVAWYSIIHTPPQRIPDVFAEFRRVLAPGGHLLLAFQAGDRPLRQTRPFGHPVSLDFRRWQPEDVADLLRQADLAVLAQMRREPHETETAPQAYILAVKPADTSRP